MELGFNATWAVLSTLALAVWIWDVRSRSLERSAVVRGIGALLCLILLLFPVISVTDDLHGSDLIEVTTPDGRKVLCSSPNHGPQVAAPFLIAAVAHSVTRSPGSRLEVSTHRLDTPDPSKQTCPMLC